MIKRVSRNPFVLFLPFLLYYLYNILRHRFPALYGDESRYITFAQNLLHGFYSPPAPHINLWNGPGYPIILMPLLALHVPMLKLCLLNAFLLYLAVVFLYKALLMFVRQRIAILFGLLLALNPNLIELSLSVFTEVFTVFLLSLFIYLFALYYTGDKKKHLVMAGAVLGFLALTKVIFGYVLLAGLLVSLAGLLINRVRIRAAAATALFVVAYLLTAPYLAYTFKLTHKLFYWGNSGGMSLYWMSTPYDTEYGDWKESNLRNSTFPASYNTIEGDSILRKNHGPEIAHILTFTGVKQDSAYKTAAIANIKQHPQKFARNYYYNVSRMFFGTPFSYDYQHSESIANILVGSLIFWASVVGLVVSLVNYRRLIYPVRFCLFITAVYLLLSGALSAYPRQLDIAMPLLLFWLAFVCDKLIISRLQIKPA